MGNPQEFTHPRHHRRIRGLGNNTVELIMLFCAGGRLTSRVQTKGTTFWILNNSDSTDSYFWNPLLQSNIWLKSTAVFEKYIHFKSYPGGISSLPVLIRCDAIIHVFSLRSVDLCSHHLLFSVFIAHPNIVPLSYPNVFPELLKIELLTVEMPSVWAGIIVFHRYTAQSWVTIYC